jgi:osomolarity two-component system sensor histidine kinase NIK1
VHATRAVSAARGRAIAHGQFTTLAKRSAPQAWTGSAAHHVVKRRCTSEDLTSSFLRLPAMPNEETSAAVARILSGFAKQFTPLSDGSFPTSAVPNGLYPARITLPGDETVEKKTLERELTSLATRIQMLEAKASNGTGSLPMTPNEPMSSAFGGDVSAPTRFQAVSNRQRSQSWVNSLLAKGDGEKHEPRQLTEEQLTFLREHVERQSEEIKSQKDFIDGIKSQLNHQQAATKAVLDGYGSSISIEQLKREIEKNAQINATYQKVLKEIGTIITAVANGDLSKKVLIHAMEKDPEIAKFKHTINTMVDQLQEFAGQVTHLAKEVGTEGRLGGQAIVPGVDGIWAELTRNGEFPLL